MTYLFLDTESSNSFGGVYKLCEYGFVLTDDHLHPLIGGKKDILINPGKGRESRFYLKGRRGGRDLVLAHEEKEYYDQKTFDEHYDNLKYLLTKTGSLIFFWAGENDIQAIEDNCVRYHIPQIGFVSYDVQLLYGKIMNLEKPAKLEKAMEILGIEKDTIVAHKPDDDALMTLLVLKSLCEKEGVDIKTLLERYPECKRESLSFYSEFKARRGEKKKQKQEKAERKKEAPSPLNIELNKLLAMDIPEGTPKERVFSVSKEMKVHVEKTFDKIKSWTDKGYYLKRGLQEVSYLIYYDEEEKKELASELDLTELKLLSIEEFDVLTMKE